MLNIFGLIAGTVLTMFSLYGAYRFTDDVMILFWIIAFAIGYSIILLMSKQILKGG